MRSFGIFPDIAIRTPRQGGKNLMIDDNSRGFAEAFFQSDQRPEKEIKDALKLEAERHEAALKNMHRLRALRLQRDDQSKIR
jgi:hypothetical protein